MILVRALYGGLPRHTFALSYPHSLTDILSGDDLGELIINNGGTFSSFTPYETLDTHSSYLLKLEKL